MINASNKMRPKIDNDIKNQMKTSQKYLSFLFEGKLETAWELMDEDVTNKISYKQFVQLVKIFKSYSDYFGKKVEMIGYGYTGTNSMLYVFTFIDENKTPSIFIKIYFKNKKSAKIVGINVMNNTQRILTSPNPELIIDESLKWRLHNTKYNIYEVVLIQFPRSSNSMLAIKVFYDNIDSITEDKANKIGIPIARAAISKGFYQEAKQIARNMDYTISDGIGVSFVNINKKTYRVNFDLKDL